MTAYQAASVSYGNSCTSKSRSCSNGSLSDSYSFGSCTVQSPATCSFNGQTIAHDASLTAYQVNSVAYGEECSSETRNCSNGTLGGTYSNSSCSVAAAASCSFGGQTVAQGSSITAYLSDSVAYGQTCSTQTRSCSNGTLSGTYTNSSCSVATPASCSLNGQTVAHGSYLKMYAYDEVPSMQSGLDCTCENSNSDILCQGGILMTNMNYQHTSCEAVPASTCAFYTSQVSYYDAPFVIVADGDSIIAYRHNLGDTWLGSCSELKEIREYSNGSLSG